LHDELVITTSLISFAGGTPVIVDSRIAASVVRIDIPIGAVLPLHSTSMGKVFLATLQDVKLGERLAAIVTLHTPPVRSSLQPR
jgi:DNA-binding IclR family transcriptional regulator